MAPWHLGTLAPWHLGTFGPVGIVDSFGLVNPQPMALKKLLEYTKLPPVEHLMIGGPVKVDLIPAKKLGLRTCLVWEKSDHPAVDISLPKIYDIVKLLL